MRTHLLLSAILRIMGAETTGVDAMEQRKKSLRSIVWTSVSILFGNALLAFLVEAFVVPHGIIMGGTTGLGIVLNRLLGVDTAGAVLVMNTALLLLGGVVLGRKLLTTTVASSLLYPVFLALAQRTPGLSTITDNSLMAALFAGVLMGVALGVVMRVGSSTGGIDIVCLVLNKWTHIPVSVCVYMMDVLVIGGQALVSTAQPILYGLVVLVLESLVLDKVMILGQAQIQLFIISQQYAEIRRRILTELEAGATMIQIETGALQQTQQGVMCVIPNRKLFAAKELVQQVDPTAFITITQVREVRGRGFTLERAMRELKEEQE